MEEKTRKSNYAAIEKEILLKLVKKYQNIFDNKDTNAQWALKKQQTWKLVSQQYNKFAITGPRTWQQLRHLYTNIKQRSKNKNIHRADRLQFIERSLGVQDESSLDKVEELNHTIEKSSLLSQDPLQIQPQSNSHDDEDATFLDDVQIRIDRIQSENVNLVGEETTIHEIKNEDVILACINLDQHDEAVIEDSGISVTTVHDGITVADGRVGKNQTSAATSKAGKRSKSPDTFEWGTLLQLHLKTKEEMQKKCRRSRVEDYELEKESTTGIEKTCSECVLFKNSNENDSRNDNFSRLLQEELKYIRPCMRTRAYAKMLNFVHGIRARHSSDIHFTEFGQDL